MKLNRWVAGGLRRIKGGPYRVADRAFVALDRRHVRRTDAIRAIPYEPNRRGGKYAYAEWAYVIGVFQTLLYGHMPKPEGNDVLDIGCGTGLLGIASKPFVGAGGSYTGLDVGRRDVAFCQRHYRGWDGYSFVHVPAANAAYAPEQAGARPGWPIPDASTDVATALSVWTHLGEADALFYFEELARVLRPGGKAVVTFFILDEAYRASLSQRGPQEGRFHSTQQDLWVFDRPAYASEDWFTTAWAGVPEHATAVTERGLSRLMEASGLELVERHAGTWKEQPGLYFQDVLVFQKP